MIKNLLQQIGRLFRRGGTPPRPDKNVENLLSFLRGNAGGFFPSYALSLHDELYPPNQRLIELCTASVTRAFQIDLAQNSSLAKSEVAVNPDAVKYLNVYPGEHYRLLAALVEVLKPKVVIEIGTYRGLSALVMKSFLLPDGLIVTYDLVSWNKVPSTAMRASDFDSRLTQRVCDLTQSPIEARDLEILRRAEFIFIDAAKDWSTEAKLCKVLDQIPFERPPIVVFDDIRMLSMIELWRRIPHPKMDMTSFGHYSGTGVVEWGGR